MLLGLVSVLAHQATAKEDIPLLNAGLISQSYEVSFVSAPFMAEITFHRPGRFFIVGRANNEDLLKFDATGQKVFELKYSADHFRPRFSPYVTTRGGIYDLSQKSPRRLPITGKFNSSERKLSRARFVAEFSPHYARADVVVYGGVNDANAKHAIYLRTAGKWTIFYVSSFSIDIDRDYDLGSSIAEFPPKFERMVLLSDPPRKRYSYSDYRLRDRKIRLPEDKLRYARSPSLKRTSYRSGAVFETIPYTPIPGSFRGIATYRLSVGGEQIVFREMATRGTLRARATFNLSLFVLPRPYDQEVPVSFLEFRPLSNIDTLGSDGLYIIRPRR